MKVLIRVDANSKIGIGHVMRCAAIGKRLQEWGATVHFVCLVLPVNVAEWLIQNGFELTQMPIENEKSVRFDLIETIKVALLNGPFDLLIVDHYGLDARWESEMRGHTRSILVIDDLANRHHDCDFLLDQNLHDNANIRYQALVPNHTILFMGPKYAALRKEFNEVVVNVERSGEVKRLLIFFGGTDPGFQTLKVLDALRGLGQHAPESIVVLGPAYPSREKIHENAVGLTNVLVLDSTDCMSKLIKWADLGIGTCGISAWERCVFGLPSLVVVTADNQREDAEILHKKGAVLNLGNADLINVKEWKSAIMQTTSNPKQIRAMSLASQSVMAGRAAAIEEFEKVLLNALH